jgi:hypothetical protein
VSLSRASTSYRLIKEKDVDGRDEPGHDDGTDSDYRQSIPPRKSSSSFSLTRYLPLYSSGRLPTLSM